MARFESRNVSESDVPASRQAIWDVITSPDTLARLTPIIETITADGDLWTWQIKTVSAVGARLHPSFTERMTFEDGRLLSYDHAPPAGVHERAGARGTYTLDDLPDGGTHLGIDLTLHVELPLPRASKRAVEKVMAGMMDRTGQRFAENLYKHLGLTETPEPRTKSG